MRHCELCTGLMKRVNEDPSARIVLYWCPTCHRFVEVTQPRLPHAA